MAPTKQEVAKMTVAELKAALKDLGQPITGKKEELVERYLAHAEGGSNGTELEAAAPATAPAEAEGEAPAENPAEEAAAEAPAAGTSEEQPKEGKRPRIVFTEAAIAAMPQKIEVIKSVEPAKVVKSDAERLRERSERFKDPETEKAKKRAERFGVAHPELEKEKARKRAERFGVLTPELEEERKAKRAARFGTQDFATKVAARTDRFKPLNPTTLINTPITGATEDFEEKKKARAARFGV